MEKVPLAYSTGGQKPVKMPRRLVDMRGPELVHNKLVHKQWGIQVNTITGYEKTRTGTGTQQAGSQTVGLSGKYNYWI